MTEFRCGQCKRWLKALEGDWVQCLTCGCYSRCPTSVEDATRVIAQQCVDLVAPAILPGECRDLYESYCETIRAGIEALLQLRRMRPSRN
jgi:hypothetical protein